MHQNGTWAQRLSVRTATEMAWSPDGKQLAFVEPGVGGAMRLQVMNSISGTARNLTRQPDISDSEPAWSYDGARLAFVRTKGEHAARQSALFTGESKWRRP